MIDMSAIIKEIYKFEAEHKRRPNIIRMHPAMEEQLSLQEELHVILDFPSLTTRIYGIEVALDSNLLVGGIRVGYEVAAVILEGNSINP